MTEIVIRTYELFDIAWTRFDEETGGTYKSRWTNYDTADEAQAIIDRAVAREPRDVGVVERRTWEVEIDDPRFLTIYRPGCAERIEVR